jgi:pyrroloquinoline quinone biosynthesis protein B
VLVRVLGSAAGGGFPQWNCGCENCRGVRSGTAGSSRFRARTQESIAVSGDGESWFLINCSPEIRAQIESFPGLWPRAKRHSPIAGILFSNGDLDHVLGLLSLRESHPLVVHATAVVRDDFRKGNTMARTLDRFTGQLDWRVVVPGEEQALGGEGTKLRVTAVPISGNMPLHMKGLREPSVEDNVGYVIRDERTGGKLAYLSGVAGPSPALERAVADADVVFFDGTFWTSDELIRLGLGTRRAEDMSHWPLSGPNGSLEFLGRLPAKRRIFIHVNNTNPILDEQSPERAEVVAKGAEVAFDGLELSL